MMEQRDLPFFEKPYLWLAKAVKISKKLLDKTKVNVHLSLNKTLIKKQAS